MQRGHACAPSRRLQAIAASRPLFDGSLRVTHQASFPTTTVVEFVMTARKSIGIALAAGVALLAAPVVASAQQANSNWQGFYAGLNAGGMWGQTSAAINYSNGGGGLFGTGSGFLGGAQVGYNWLL